MNKLSGLLTREKPKAWQVILLGVLLVLFAACIWAITNAQTVRDWYILAVYKPPSSIVALADDDTMTSYAKQLFYVNEPLVESKQDFANNCPNGTEQTYVIGCYHSGDDGIYLLNVNQSQLTGIVPVTAAYEMLHAGYARLPSSERNQIDNEMWSFYVNHITDSEIEQQMAAYAKTEPGEKYDELYSVLGTEVTNLPIELETHYKMYFSDRAKITAMYANYQAAFTSRQQEIANDDSQLSGLKNEIDNNKAQLSSLLGSINSAQAELSVDQNSGDTQAYNANVPGYNNIVVQYNSLAAQTSDEIEEYNNLVDSRNSLALEEQQLVQAINAAPAQAIPEK